jgi:hypothetical protein
LRSLSKSSWVIFTFTWTTRFMRSCMKDFHLTGNVTLSILGTQHCLMTDQKIKKVCDSRRKGRPVNHKPAGHRKWTAMTITSGTERRQRAA